MAKKITKIQNGFLYSWNPLQKNWMLQREATKGAEEGFFVDGALVADPQKNKQLESAIAVPVPEMEEDRPYIPRKTPEWPITKAVKSVGNALFEASASIPGTQSNQIKQLRRDVDEYGKGVKRFTEGVNKHKSEVAEFGAGVDRVASQVRSTREETASMLSKSKQDATDLEKFSEQERQIGANQELEQKNLMKHGFSILKKCRHNLGQEA